MVFMGWISTNVHTKRFGDSLPPATWTQGLAHADGTATEVGAGPSAFRPRTSLRGADWVGLRLGISINLSVYLSIYLSILRSNFIGDIYIFIHSQRSHVSSWWPSQGPLWSNIYICVYICMSIYVYVYIYMSPWDIICINMPWLMSGKMTTIHKPEMWVLLWVFLEWKPWSPPSILIAGFKSLSNWWFQPPWKIWVRLDHHPNYWAK